MSRLGLLLPYSHSYLSHPAYHLRSELEDLSHKLYELQDEDELRKFVRPVKRSRGTRSRPVNLEGEEELTSVARYIQEREMLIQKPHEASRLAQLTLQARLIRRGITGCQGRQGGHRQV